jgi:hypothetical protein
MPNIPITAVIAVVILVVGYLIGVWTGPDTDALEARVAELESQVEAQGGVAGAAETAAGEAQAALDALSARVDEVAARVDEQAGALAESSGGVEAIEQRFNAFETSLTETVGNLEARVHDQVTALQSAVEGVESDVAGVSKSLTTFKAETAEMVKTAAEGEPKTMSDAGGTQMAAAPAGEAAAPPPAPGVHRLGIGASTWAVDGLVSVALSAVLGADSARIFVNDRQVELSVGETRRLSGLPAEAGTCEATLEGIHGNQADVRVDCES